VSASSESHHRKAHPAVHISRRRHSAILYAIEEAIRTPNPFTPVVEEEQENMSDIMGDGSHGGGRTTSSMRTPRDIMADRRAREARREAEASRSRGEEQMSADGDGRRAAAFATERLVRSEPLPSSARIIDETPGGGLPARLRSQSQSAQQFPVQSLPGLGPSQTTSDARARVSSAPNPVQSTPQSSDAIPEDIPQRPTRPSFPHAFERWEHLSSHWEGLSSYWLRKLDANTEEIRHTNPTAPALHRQIQDLSAAGANLFHGLVELQKLRASSERKFQRWFREMKQEQEKWQEIRADMLGEVNDERLAKEQLQMQLEKAHMQTRRAENVSNECRRELNIAKEEARRAWQDLGTMEADRLMWIGTLRQGLPTSIGGMQVVPLYAASQQSGERRPAATNNEAPQFQQQQQQPIIPDHIYHGEEHSPTNSDPFVEPHQLGHGLYQEPKVDQVGPEHAATSTPASTSTARTAISPQQQQQRRDLSGQELSPTLSSNVVITRPVVQLAFDGAGDEEPSDSFYQQPSGRVHQTEAELRSPASYSSNTTGDTEYVVDQHGNVRRDSQGRPIVYRAPGRAINNVNNASHMSPEDSVTDNAHTRYGVSAALSPNVVHAPTTSAEAMASFVASTAAGADADRTATASPADYEGAGYGDWESLQSRHHHPTRLSDVLEEDERSRTTID
jgi:hypothetical protein